MIRCFYHDYKVVPGLHGGNQHEFIMFSQMEFAPSTLGHPRDSIADVPTEFGVTVQSFELSTKQT